ncbi:tudor and KH domain-containing protein [Protobothrops mucrosquamatus]|uniref:tudor and KH domain-containing protein n=1 Tax=Protobothrops mucrosquamatus TaxID=103944 RepID=UPI0007758680|nr:tudor and KH domain-containing protein [Protobothrops mucrosquamatus]
MAGQRGTWAGGLTWLQKIALALGIPASAAILYILYRQYREEQEERIPFVGEDEIEFVMKVPQEAVKFLLGRQGAKANQLRKDTHARININLDDSGEERLIRIAGSPVQVCRAKAAIHQIMEENLPVAEKISVPIRAVGRIIGKGGESVRAICRTTGAKIECDREEEGVLSLTRLITLTGTRKEVQAAKELIREKLLEDEAFRNKLSQAAMSRMQRKQPLGTRREMAAGDQGERPYSHSEPPGRAPDAEYLPQEAGDGPPDYPAGDPQESSGAGAPINPWPALSSVLEVPSPDFNLQAKDHLEVYISASESPSHFWIQIIGTKALYLDKLVQEMTKYYDGSDDGEVSVQVGDIVAAYYLEDHSWYRAEVLGILDNGNLDLYYVDFGDNGEAPLEKLRLLRGDFLGLPFQAIECSLAGVAPAGPCWEEAALDEFDRLTHCAQWKLLFCKICTYQPVGSSVRPYVRLFKPANGQFVDVGEELIRLGYAVQKLSDGDGEASRDLPGNLANLAGTSLENLSETASLSEEEENTVML